MVLILPWLGMGVVEQSQAALAVGDPHCSAGRAVATLGPGALLLKP